jgi:4-amino-4-deoxy-L-arabinose transferase-like glycosyltransferase
MIDDLQSPQWEAWLQKWFFRLLIPAILVNMGGLLIPILEPDGALYATIAKTMAQTRDFINLRVEGRDWLDKPHFPFWMAALSFRLFGISSFAYKFPALLFWGAGAWYTYRFSRELYGKATAQLSALIYVSAAHLVISNNDVRAEPYLTGLVIGSVFHFYQASRVPRAISGWGWHVLAGAFLAACAMMTKGPFVLVTISAGFVLDWILGRNWGQFRAWRWWIALGLIALFVIPELYCLYLQFDTHPDKVVFGTTGVSGIRFFFWDSQFGRFFNTGPIKGSGDPFFYFHTLLWAFLPWSLLLYAGVIKKFRELGKTGMPEKEKVRGYGNAICLGAAVLSFMMFSLSRFQLPHYLNILFPFFSILTADYLYALKGRVAQKVIYIVQMFICVMLLGLVLFLCWFFHFPYWPLVTIILSLCSFLPFILFRGRDPKAIFGRSFLTALVVYGFINFCLYPAMLRYQAGMEAGKSLLNASSRSSFVGQTVYMLQETPANYSFEFYSPLPVQRVAAEDLFSIARNRPVLVFLPSIYADSIAGKGFRVERLPPFPNYHISQLTAEFLDYRVRPSVLEEYSLVRVR